jgi:hypothetical protein
MAETYNPDASSEHHILDVTLWEHRTFFEPMTGSLGIILSFGLGVAVFGVCFRT